MKRTILIADDEYGFRYPLLIYLKQQGHDVMEAKNRDEIFKNIGQFDILMMDVIFPKNKEGIDIVKEIRNRESELNKKIPVIFYSILNENMCAEELKDIDKKSYVWLHKPFELTAVDKAISYLIENYK